jgi:hypothetical protein
MTIKLPYRHSYIQFIIKYNKSYIHVTYRLYIEDKILHSPMLPL